MTSTSAFGGRTPAGSSGRLLPSGETAVLAEVADLDAALALYRRLDSTRPPGVVDLVLGARTVLAVGRTAADLMMAAPPPTLILLRICCAARTRSCIPGFSGLHP